MTITDLVILLFIFAFAAQGWRQGIVRALIGPASLFLSAAFAVVYYQKTQNLALVSAIVFLGPLALGLILSLVLSWWNALFTRTKSVSWLSQLLGGFFAMIWGGIFLLLVLVLLMLLPATRLPIIKTAQSNIRNSISYRIVRSYTRQRNLALPSFEENLKILSDPSRLEDLQSTEEFKDLEQDPRIQAIMSDEELLKEMEQKNFAALLSNPKVLAMMQDKELIKKLLELNQRIAETASEEKSAGPAVYEFKTDAGGKAGD